MYAKLIITANLTDDSGTPLTAACACITEVLETEKKSLQLGLKVCYNEAAADAGKDPVALSAISSGCKNLTATANELHTIPGDILAATKLKTAIAAALSISENSIEIKYS